MDLDLLPLPEAQGPRIPPHCGKCGRFIRPATIRQALGYWSECDDNPTGHCAKCGPVYVSWERA